MHGVRRAKRKLVSHIIYARMSYILVELSEPEIRFTSLLSRESYNFKNVRNHNYTSFFFNLNLSFRHCCILMEFPYSLNLCIILVYMYTVVAYINYLF